ncbi:FadR/GntR family transcriptional regulator [Jiangella endophytica]|uniref:FadR/GntR family transcriptional regulator n=1 Tax=Jiangella endophytica TaxID=1623398 RepID=UPI000E34A47E|nr:FadR/GntR family transcriptional regulator [Jiangella endophytica]
MTTARPIDRATAGNLTQELVRIVTEQIHRGDLRPGDRLPTEEAMAATYGVSRTVVREAVSRLNAAGLVQTQHGRGTHVLTSGTTVPFEVGAGEIRTLEDMVELLDFRLGIEVEAAGLAAAVRSDDELARLHTELEQFESASQRPGDSVEADVALHRAVARASHNRYVAQVLDALGPVMIALPQARLEMSGGSAGGTHLARVAMEHRNIVDAIERGSPEDARAAMRVHLSNSRGRLLASG